MPELTILILIFVALGAFFLFFHLLLGKLVRPIVPEEDKLTIYECGEPTIGSAWVQFDVRYYVVALLFVIFDVEVAFFFPWAIVFGKANTLAQTSITQEQRELITQQLTPVALPATPDMPAVAAIAPDAGRYLAWIGFFDILVFFGVLLVGFAYLWKRGDIDWVRSVAAEEPALAGPPAEPTEAPVLIGAGR